MKEGNLKKGQPITFRIPSAIPPHTLQKLQQLKVEEKRNFSSRIAQFVMDGIDHTLVAKEEVITLPLPKELNETQRDWLKHEQSVALLGSVIYEITSNPVRAAQLFAFLNKEAEESSSIETEEYAAFSPVPKKHISGSEESLEQFTWTSPESFVETDKSMDDDEDPLREFLLQMNK